MHLPKMSPIMHTSNKGNIHLHKDHALKMYRELQVKLHEFSNIYTGWG
jgi:hypothetical protein